MTAREVGSRATYTCRSELKLVGSSTRTCLPDGSWSGSEPICNCMMIVCFLFTELCPTSKDVHVSLTDTYTVWCPSLEDPGHGSISEIFNYGGGRVYYRCNSGYRLFGSPYRTCQLSGTWSGSRPTCISKQLNCLFIDIYRLRSNFQYRNIVYAETCSFLSYPNHGRVSVTTHDVGGRAIYTCDSGFRLVGSLTRTCLSDGSWSGSQPLCICMLKKLDTLLCSLVLRLSQFFSSCLYIQRFMEYNIP